MLAEILEQTRRMKPLIHCITNYVTANDCANLVLASGASPIMADDPEEVCEITGKCSGLVLNMGTPNPGKIKAMLLAGKEAKRLGHPIILDPVGVGSSRFRMDAAKTLLQEVSFSVIRGNAGEIRTLLTGAAALRGVDTDQIPDDPLGLAKSLADRHHCIIVLTGEQDIVTDGKRSYRISNGHPMMRYVTGAGCQLSSLLGAYTASNPDNLLEASLAAVCAMGLCGEIAFERLSEKEGNASYRNYIIDALFHLRGEELEKGAKYEIC